MSSSFSLQSKMLAGGGWWDETTLQPAVAAFGAKFGAGDTEKGKIVHRFKENDHV